MARRRRGSDGEPGLLAPQSAKFVPPDVPPVKNPKRLKRGGKVHGGHTKPRLDKRARGGKVESFHTPSGGVSAHGRKEAKSKGQTMPGTGGKFPIRNLSDLAKAKHDIGRTNEPREKVVRWIDKRAKELGGKPVGG